MVVRLVSERENLVVRRHEIDALRQRSETATREATMQLIEVDAQIALLDRLIADEKADG